ncbi:hypothetical protein VMT65_29225 [Nocardia sp. CDC153]|nr:hypothetical protein [Nocardia sp. CDC153]MEC3957148.1 hypothetical protein [Nocardia sp. CDC153]
MNFVATSTGSDVGNLAAALLKLLGITSMCTISANWVGCNPTQIW